MAEKTEREAAQKVIAAGRSVADPGSMVQAVLLAARLAASHEGAKG